MPFRCASSRSCIPVADRQPQPRRAIRNRCASTATSWCGVCMLYGERISLGEDSCVQSMPPRTHARLAGPNRFNGHVTQWV